MGITAAVMVGVENLHKRPEGTAMTEGKAYRNIMHCYKDGNAWCAIYPMHSNLMDCEAVVFVDEDIRFNEHLGGERDYGPRKALAKLREELFKYKNDNHSVSTSYYCEAWV